jgi:hypothetical protein
VIVVVHDGWLETLSLTEPASGARAERRHLSLHLRLLGAYHDGFIELTYSKVFSYHLEVADGSQGHRDWRYDEFRLAANGMLIHEIEWSGATPTGSWLIEAADVAFRWVPQKD